MAGNARSDRLVKIGANDAHHGCFNCGVRGRTKVIDSRWIENMQVTRRRRECAHCQARWTTYEVEARTLEGMGINQKRVNTILNQFAALMEANGFKVTRPEFSFLPDVTL